MKVKEYKPIEAIKMNNHAHSFMMCHESEVRDLESKYKQALADKEVLRGLVKDGAKLLRNRITYNSWIIGLEEDFLREADALQPIEDKTKGGIE